MGGYTTPGQANPTTDTWCGNNPLTLPAPSSLVRRRRLLATAQAAGDGDRSGAGRMRRLSHTDVGFPSREGMGTL